MVRRRAAALALFLASGLAAALAIEGAARLWLRVPPPARLRDGVFVSGLPLINGHPSCRWTPTVAGEPLALERRPGELRVFVFGESSVQGSPWDYPGSPATMLRDRLAARLPGRPVTVVNMGRSCSSMMDSYYYLLSAAPYRPDFVVFYQGSNDRFDADRERCLPESRPALHAAWRFLAARSRALWAIRVLSPRAFRRWEERAPTGPVPPGAPRCDADAAFARWTRILIGTAKGLGAAVVVTTPVRNPLLPLELEAWTPERRTVAGTLARAGERYREAFRCELTPGCAPRGEPGSAGAAEIESRAEAWKASAAAGGAAFVDFRARLRREAPRDGGAGRFFVGETHLTLEGYGLLAGMWADAVAGRTGGADAPVPGARRYADDLRAAGAAPEGVFYSEGMAYLRARMLLLAAPSLRRAAEGGVADAALVAAALRRAAGLPSRVPAAFDLEGHLRRPPEPAPKPAAPPGDAREALDAFAKGDYAKAEAGAERLLARAPADATGLLLRGSARLHDGRPAAALADFDALVAASPGPAVLADALSGRGRTLDRLGRAAEAAKDYERALAAAPAGWSQRAAVASLLDSSRRRAR